MITHQIFVFFKNSLEIVKEKNLEFVQHFRERLKTQAFPNLQLIVESISSGTGDDSIDYHTQQFDSIHGKEIERILVSLYNLEATFYQDQLGPGQKSLVHSKLSVFFSDSRGSNEATPAENPAYFFVYNTQSSPPIPIQLRYDNVVLGGTFDYLHSGHKILLSMAAWFCSKRLVVGVSDFAPERIAKKRFKEYMQSLDTRIETVTSFLNGIARPGILVQVVGIKDDFGPTRTDPEMDLIVGSAETAKGCEMVNQLRKDNGLCHLDIYLVDCIGESTNDIANKISSSNIREYLHLQSLKG